MWHRETGAGIVLRPGKPGQGCRADIKENCTPMARCQELKEIKEEKFGLGEMMKTCSRTVQAVWGSTKLPELWAGASCLPWAEVTCTGFWGSAVETDTQGHFFPQPIAFLLFLYKQETLPLWLNDFHNTWTLCVTITDTTGICRCQHAREGGSCFLFKGWALHVLAWGTPSSPCLWLLTWFPVNTLWRGISHGTHNMTTLFSWQMLFQGASKVPFFRHSLPIISVDNTQ